MRQERTALVLGATGGIGGTVARRLKARGWHVRAMARQGRMLAACRNFEWVAGDAMNASDVARAANGAALIVHAVNPPGYRDWQRLVLPMLDNTIAAAKSEGARILLPGTVYNYGPDAFPEIDEASPQNPVTRKGKIREEMERRLEVSAGEGARALILRAGDFFGPRAGNNWFSQGLVKPGKPVTSITCPGTMGVGHQWAYLPDVAETMAALAERENELDDFATFHMNGHWDEDGNRMVEAIRRATGNPTLRAYPMPWPVMRLLSPVVPLFRELVEMRYLWRQPIRLRNDRLIDFLGAEPHTPLDRAVRETLEALGCLPPAGRATARTVRLAEGR
ncbi:NAD(P)H-binding protein [Lutibaculum baratangense]|uniref:Nucleoside-diphosphate-sugar epimerase n=1 Tax=Lutibaculum baratangense AMV1 TaxID=631454 RepID=V4RF71_9HYPH|nr:NAD(P)H-binding protein [Lutibaculum baratangense]ESR24791.1 Nucleoside-diphosphate-sugar epimerase [Lutibaculum baratangense AMV1]